MVKSIRIVGLLALCLPLGVSAQVPVYDANNPIGSSRSPAGNVAAGGYGGSTAAVPVSAQGQLFMQLQQLQQEVTQLRGQLEEQQHEIQRLRQEGLDRYQELDRRLTGGTTTSQSSAPLPVTDQADGTIAPPVGSLPPVAPAQPGDPEKEKLYYDAAFDQIKVRDFDKANQAFTAFLRKYPHSQYAGNAQYWLGEVNLAQGNLQGAADAFAKVGQAYPDSPKVADSLYKLGDVTLRMGNSAKAKTTLQQVVSKYPGSSAAQLAQQALKGL